MDLINRLLHLAGMLAERHPSQVATSSVVALRRGLAALVVFRPGQSLQAPVQFLHLPAHLHGLNHHFSGQMRGQVVGNELFNVAVRGY